MKNLGQRAKLLSGRSVGLLLATAAFALLALSAPHWLPDLLAFAGANADTIEGMTNLAQWVLWFGALLLAGWQWWRGRRPGAASEGPSSTRIEVTDHGIVAAHGAMAAGQLAVGRDVGGSVFNHPTFHVTLPGPPATPPPPSEQQIATKRTRYLRHLVEKHQFLSILGMGVTDRVPLRLPLLELYVPLTARQKAPEGEAVARGLRLAGREPTAVEVAEMGEQLGGPRPILELLSKHDGLVVLGDPGAGKSTFLKYLAVSLSSGGGAELGFGERVPLLLSLGGYAEALTHGDVPLDDYFVRHYQGRGIDLDLAPVLAEALGRGRALVLLDGLDEVTSLETRHLVADRVKDFYTVHREAGNKFVLTSRIVGYSAVALVLEGLTECWLLDFGEPEIEAFVDRWTRALEKAAYGAGAAAEYEAQDQKEGLLRALRNNPGVRELAANPLLLTILAVMKRQAVELPEQRVKLYDVCVESLLKDWYRARSLSGRAQEPPQKYPTALKVLAPVALWMQNEAPGAGLVREGDLRRFLVAHFEAAKAEDPEAEAEAFLAVARVSNLLVDRGDRQFGFLHLTFQEYLAAVALTQRSQKTLEPVISAISDHVGDATWREVSRLAIAHLGVVKQDEERAAVVIDHLLEHQPGEPGEAEILAGLALLDLGPDGIPTACRERGVAALLRTLTDSPRVPPIRRAEAGRVLAELGDPRTNVTTLDGMEFCWVPPGPFQMGSGDDDPEGSEFERPQHPVDLAGYWMARFPVTAGQWREYVEASRAEIKDRNSLTGAANEPAVLITWHDALACCRWLTGKWRQEGWLPEGWEVRLPSEAEWEKAARGGFEVPVEGRCAGMGSLPRSELVLEMEPNPNRKRAYPWGEVVDPERANYDDTGIGRPSAVGAFPAGKSPYGCEELSGNVFEWTRSLWGKDWQKPDFGYPYLATDGREGPQADDETRRVLRGGSCFNFTRIVSCSFRFWYFPFDRVGSLGFRLLLSPFFSEP